jgi:DNA end-binding protein Ku
VPKRKLKGEMLRLAEHIIKTKCGNFDPSTFDDQYEAALAELIKAKLEGRRIEIRKPPKPEKPVDLLTALRESATPSGKRMGRRAVAKPVTASAHRKAS